MAAATTEGDLRVSRAARCALQSCELAAARVVDPLGPTVANANSASAAKYAAYVSSFLLFSFFWHWDLKLFLAFAIRHCHLNVYVLCVCVCVCVFILVIWLIAEICKFGERIRVGHEERKPEQGNQCTCA